MARHRSPSPWRAHARSYTQSGKFGQWQIVDAAGKPIRLTNAMNRALLATAPELADALDKLVTQAAMWHHILAKEIGHSVSREVIDNAEHVLRTLHQREGAS